MIRAVAVVLVLAVSTASADPDLRVQHAPPPKHLSMRRRVATAPARARVPAPAPAAGGDPVRVPMPAPPALESDAIGGIGGLRDPNQPVTFQLDTGYSIDGTEASAQNTNLGGQAVRAEADYARLRSYGFGDAYVGTHGVGFDSLQTFFAARTELVQAPNVQAGTTSQPLPPPLADWFERSNWMIRSAWAELHGVSEAAWLAPLRVRAGEVYVYGPWIAHIRGALAAWEGKIVTAETYAGVRAPDYASYEPLSLAQAFVGGGSLRLDLRALTSLPIAITARTMDIGAIDGTPASHHDMLEVDWRPRRDLVVHTESRWLDNAFANGHAQVRYRYKLETNFLFDATYRTSADWIWDPSLTQQDQVGEARRYLDLGPIVPQVLLSARAGTVLFENIDLLVRGAYAGENTSAAAAANSTAWSAPYLELAGAADLRLRRTVTLGASLLTRQNTTPQANLPPPIVDIAGPQPLTSLDRMGQEGFFEVGGSAKMSLGARRFSAMVEVYGRRTRYEDAYCAPDTANATCAMPVTSTAPLTSELRGGGRVTVDAWVNRNLRLFASYDVSSSLAQVPEITGYKSLRLVVEGVY